MVTEPGASTHTSRVFGRSMAASPAGSIGSYRRHEMPHRLSTARACSLDGP